MARVKGQATYASNFEVAKEAALDARTVVGTKADLTLAATWADDDGNVWLYNGLIVAVRADESDGGGLSLYGLADKDNYQEESSWTRVGGGAVSDEAAAAIATAKEEAISAAATTANSLIDTAVDSLKDTYLPSNYVKSSQVGASGGVASLDESGKIPSAQLPSYVDDVLEYDTLSGFPTTGETGKIYVDKATNKTYRWSGTAYVEISASLAIGETEATAFAGSRGVALETSVSALQTAVNTAQDGVDANTESVKALQTSVSANTANIATNAANISTNTAAIASNTSGVASLNTWKSSLANTMTVDSLLISPDATTVTVEIDGVAADGSETGATQVDATIPAATTTAAGAMTATDKTALDALESVRTTAADSMTFYNAAFGSSATATTLTLDGYTVGAAGKSGLSASLAAATTTTAGVMTAEDKTALDELKGMTVTMTTAEI